MAKKSIDKKNNSQLNTKVSRRDFVELKRMVQQNQFYLKKLNKYTSKIDKFLFWFRVRTGLKIFIIVAPLIIAYFYVVPWLQTLINQYKGVFKVLQ